MTNVACHAFGEGYATIGDSKGGPRPPLLKNNF